MEINFNSLDKVTLENTHWAVLTEHLLWVALSYFNKPIKEVMPKSLLRLIQGKDLTRV